MYRLTSDKMNQREIRKKLKYILNVMFVVFWFLQFDSFSVGGENGACVLSPQSPLYVCSTTVVVVFSQSGIEGRSTDRSYTNDVFEPESPRPDTNYEPQPFMIPRETEEDSFGLAKVCLPHTLIIKPRPPGDLLAPSLRVRVP